MSTYKKLNRQDVYVTVHDARKQWHTSGSLLRGFKSTNEYSIDKLIGVSGSTEYFLNDQDLYQYATIPTQQVQERHKQIVYKSIHNLYYSGKVQDSTFSGSFDNYLETTLHLSESRDLHNVEEISVFSVPQEVFGTNIVPFSFILKPNGARDNYVDDGFVTDEIGLNDYIQTFETLFGAIRKIACDYILNEGTYVLETPAAGGEYIDSPDGQHRVEIVDDGEGRLIMSGSGSDVCAPVKIVGDIIYSHGQVILTDPDVIAIYNSFYLNPKLQWKSNHPIYTYNMNCKVKDSELNFTYNPSAITGSFGDIDSNITDNTFSPYITTVGLYNNANELLAVGKLAQPTRKSLYNDMTFVVKIDM
jgi:hypothetical protein